MRLRIVLPHSFSSIEVYFHNRPTLTPHKSPSFNRTEGTHPIFFSIDIYDCSIIYIGDRLRDDSSLGSDEDEVDLSPIRNALGSYKAIFEVNYVAIEC